MQSGLEAMQGVVAVTNRGRPIKCRTLGQKRYMEAIDHNTVNFAIGPAGTGKTLSLIHIFCCFAPFVSSRCVKKPKEGGKAQERFEKIAEGAVKQCGRAAEVRILQPLSFKEVLEKIPRHDAVLFAYEKSEIALRQVFEQVREQRDIALIVGPEGGFSEREAEQILSLIHI